MKTSKWSAVEKGVEKAHNESLAIFFDFSQINPTPKIVNMDSNLSSSVSRFKMYRDTFWRTFMHPCKHWHKFIVNNGAFYEKEVMLKSIVDAVHPGDIIPVMYHTEGLMSIFFARNCTNALDRLFRIGMSVTLPDGKMVSIETVLCYIPITGTQLSVQQRLTKCITKRYNPNNFSLNLTNFHKDPELYDIIYCPLSEPKILSFVMMVARGLKQNIRSICLAGNELSMLQPLSSLVSFNTLKVLDLGNNKLNELYALNVLQLLKLTELVVAGNPLCKQYHDDVTTYVRKIREIIPTLKKLDGVNLCEDNELCWHRNYLISHEAIALVDQFLEHYFTLFDGENRQKLRGMYHERAVFSMTASYLPGQNTSSTASLTQYTMVSRNLLKTSDYTKSSEQLSRGAKAVLATLCMLPRTEHDPYSFAVDCVQYSADHAVINVTGVFREPSLKKLLPMRWFNRTFILLRVASQQYQIVNEMLHISNATSNQVREAFHILHHKSVAKAATNPGDSITESDKQKMVEILSQLTEMNLCWAKKCLDESKWDIKDALQVFTELLKMDQIPVEAFAKDNVVPETITKTDLES